MKRPVSFLLAMLVILLISCQLPTFLAGKTATPSPAQPPTTQAGSPTPLATRALAATQARGTDKPPAQTPKPLVYYSFVDVSAKSIPEGSIVILQDILILGPAVCDAARSSDTAANLRAALQAAIDAPNNAWQSHGLSISSVTFKDGAANVALKGVILAPGDVVMIAARMQFLMTVFAEAAVQTATITRDGENIANLGISHESEARPTDYVYTRAEIETYMAQNAYKKP